MSDLEAMEEQQAGPDAVFEAAATELLAAKTLGQEPEQGWHDAASVGILRLLELKAAHRALCEATEGLREATGETKAQLDQSSLQLQNLLYERQHYEREIASCRAFRSAYSEQQLELLPEGQFMQLKEVKEGGMAVEDPHDRMLSRLAHELQWRENTVKDLEALKAKRDALAAEVAQKRSQVGGLESEMGRLRAAAQKVGQQYGIQQQLQQGGGGGAAAAEAGEVPTPAAAAAEPAAAAEQPSNSG